VNRVSFLESNLGKRGRVSEEGLLERIKRSFAGGDRARGDARFVSLGMGDDAALVRPGRGYETVFDV